MIVWKNERTGLARTLDQVPKGAQVLEVDGVYCIGLCEICEKPILEGMEYESDEEGIIWHMMCDDKDLADIER